LQNERVVTHGGRVLCVTALGKTVAAAQLRAYQLAKDIGISQKSAWFVIHRIREALKENYSQMLDNTVEVDETYVGGQKEGTRGRGAEGKTLVLVAVEGEEKQKLGRVRFRCIQAIDQVTAESFVRDCVFHFNVFIGD